ncbi:MAG: lysostaphin resistance A-like protein [Candidatus Hodarchaeota archaeon]
MKKYSTNDLWIRVVLFFAICVILIFSFQVFILPLLRELFNNGEEFKSLTLELSIVRAMNGIVGLGLVYVFLIFDRRKMDVVGLKWNSNRLEGIPINLPISVEWILIGIPIALLGLIPTVIIEIIFKIVEFGALLDIIGIIVTLLVTVLAIGLGEEILFRGYLQTILETKYSFLVAALISSFLFGLLHFVLASTSTVYHMIAILFSAMVMGLTFSYCYKVTQYNLILPVAIHGFWDFFLFIFQADFIYEDWTAVFFEILASIIGATTIFLLVHIYRIKRLNSSSQKEIH